MNKNYESMKKDIKDALIQENIRRIKSNSPSELLEFLSTAHPSDAYIIIRDIITDYQKKEISKDEELKKLFSKIKSKAKQGWDLDHKLATIADVRAASTEIYTKLLNAISKLNIEMRVLKEVTDKFARSIAEPVLESIAEPVLESIAEPVLESIAEPVLESIAEPVLKKI